MISTYPDTYHNVPDDDTLLVLQERCSLHMMSDLADDQCLDFAFTPDAREVTVTTRKI